MAKIVTVYSHWSRDFRLVDMSYIRWLKISEALARRGHQVDIATGEFGEMNWRRKKSPILMGENLRRVPLSGIRWSDYDVVKTLFHAGFETLEKYGGERHPFIISKLGSVVGPEDRDGIYFYGKQRERLYATQKRIHQTSRYVTVLNAPAKQLWTDCMGPRDNILIVPGGVDRSIPPALHDPFPRESTIRCLFAGNVYGPRAQREANRVLIEKLNHLGGLIHRQGARLYLVGPGDARNLDQRHVTYLGVVSYEESWSYLHFAQVGVVVAAGKFMHNNESSKIYHYLRAGLPVVSEAGFPNDHVVEEAKLGFVVENGNLDLMAEKIIEAAHHEWDRDGAINYILTHHTWDHRVEVYDRIIREALEE